MKRGKAADLIDDVRKLVAQGHCPPGILVKYGLEPLEPCRGEAHSNAHIDHCSLCAPRWGYVGKREPVT